MPVNRYLFTDPGPLIRYLEDYIDALELGLLAATGGHDFVQDTDPTLNVPNLVVAKDRWWKTSTKTVYVRNDANNAWDNWSGDHISLQGTP
jgi:hypothetical protein